MERIDLQPGQEIILKPGETIVSVNDEREIESLLFVPPGMEVVFLDKQETGVYYWTSSRGDKWEKSFGSNYCEAAEEQAKRWQQLGYKGPFIVLIGFLANQPEPPSKGAQVIQLKLEVVTSFIIEAVGSIQITE